MSNSFKYIMQNLESGMRVSSTNLRVHKIELVEEVHSGKETIKDDDDARQILNTFTVLKSV